MIIERTRPKAHNTELEDVETPLDSSSPNEQSSAMDEVCLLRDSPFRILRVSEKHFENKLNKYFYLKLNN